MSAIPFYKSVYETHFLAGDSGRSRGLDHRAMPGAPVSYRLKEIGREQADSLSNIVQREAVSCCTVLDEASHFQGSNVQQLVGRADYTTLDNTIIGQCESLHRVSLKPFKMSHKCFPFIYQGSWEAQYWKESSAAVTIEISVLKDT